MSSQLPNNVRHQICQGTAFGDVFLREHPVCSQCVVAKLSFGFESRYRLANFHGLEKVVDVDPYFLQSLDRWGPKRKG